MENAKGAVDAMKDAFNEAKQETEMKEKKAEELNRVRSRLLFDFSSLTFSPLFVLEGI